MIRHSPLQPLVWLGPLALVLRIAQDWAAATGQPMPRNTKAR